MGLNSPAQLLSRPHGPGLHATLFRSGASQPLQASTAALLKTATGRPTAPSSTPQEFSSSLEVRASRNNRGLGVFATRPIPAYTPIIDAPPLLTMSRTDDLPQVFAAHDALPPDQQAIFAALAHAAMPERNEVLTAALLDRGHAPDQVADMARISSIFLSNAFNVSDGSMDGVARALIPEIARLNHSCAPNAHTVWLPGPGRMRATTLRAIAPGEEVEIAYFSILLPRADRQERASKWGFVCACPVCGDGDSDGGDTDGGDDDGGDDMEARRANVRSLQQVSTLDRDLRARVGASTRMAMLCDEEASLRAQLPIALDYSVASRVALFKQTGEARLLQQVETVMKFAILAEKRITGADSPPTMQREENLRAFQAWVSARAQETPG